MKTAVFISVLLALLGASVYLYQREHERRVLAEHGYATATTN